MTWDRTSADASDVDVPLHPSGHARAQSVFRYTDLIVREDDVIWGADDLLGRRQFVDDPDARLNQRVGARMFRASKDAPWRPEAIGYVGNPVRSIVDVSHGYVVITEAKGLMGYCPQVLLLSKSEPPVLIPLAVIDNFATRATDFTHSCASRQGKDGVFFSYRKRTDAFDGGPSILRWQIEFE